MKKKKENISIVGGAGHVGLPLSLIFANKGYNVNIYDKDEKSLALIKKNKMPFMEENALSYLKKANLKKKLILSSNINELDINGPIIICIGTPVDEFNNPTVNLIFKCIDEIKPFLKSNSLIIFRSTLFPGSSEVIKKYLRKNKLRCLLSFCPERILQGKSIKEIKKLPQIVSSFDKESSKQTIKLFTGISPSFIECNPHEAELIKLFTNSFRYINFAIANQFYKISKNMNINFNRLAKIMSYKYPRVTIPSAGFAAGPCLYKDTQQLSSYSKNEFSLGSLSININEGFIFDAIDEIKNNYNINNTRVGILGMSFKANIDDTRSSLSYKLKKYLKLYAKDVLTHDPYVKNDKSILNIKEFLYKSDVFVLCTPHDYYKKINFGKKRVIDFWGLLDNNNIKIIK
tara:strand:+ start:2228 stop:3433 length:1206 start_codon:yes stop_codon:yes gene_type:complete